MSKFFLYFHTLKYLKFTQIFHRVLKKIRHPKARTIQGNVANVTGNWIHQELYPRKFISESDVNFLNHKGSVKCKEDWNDINQEKLWLYNLHYFDDLNSERSEAQQKLQLSWIKRWIIENPASDGGNGWEAYTLSLRIVNWIKAFLSGVEYDKEMQNSLVQQADFLTQDLEKHLLGNHYFVNLKALIFAGCFFQGKASDRFLAIGLKDFEVQLKEQVLNDGGSFELTPMYHAIMLTDLLDLANLFKAFPGNIPNKTVELVNKTIIKMFGWLEVMSHGDDKVSFFNDSAFGIAPDNRVLRTYAQKLGFSLNSLEHFEDRLTVYNLQNSGYVSVKSADISLIADLANVGPSYIPGHAHADSLSFELSLGDLRFFVNSGTSEYGMKAERLRQRGTAAHNSVVINDINSSEVWSGFRVARRAEIGNRQVGNVSSNQTVEFSAAHNGYKKQGINCIHHRAWHVSLDELSIDDVLQGEYENAVAYFHLHPNVNIKNASNTQVVLLVDGYELHLEVLGGELAVEKSTWHPEFGVVIPSEKLKVQFLSSQVCYKISWNKI